jgi:glycerol-3-phosphate O-acyltransferase
MSLYQRQCATVAQIEEILRRDLLSSWRAAERSKLSRKTVDAMVRDGYTLQEAKDSFRQCDDMARLNFYSEVAA